MVEQSPQEHWQYISGALATLVGGLIYAIRRLIKIDTRLDQKDRDLLLKLEADMQHLQRLSEKMDHLEDAIQRQDRDLANLRGRLGT